MKKQPVVITDEKLYRKIRDTLKSHNYSYSFPKSPRFIIWEKEKYPSRGIAIYVGRNKFYYRTLPSYGTPVAWIIDKEIFDKVIRLIEMKPKSLK